MTTFKRRIAWITVSLLILLNCTGNDEKVSTADIPQGLWRAVLSMPGGELPFHFELMREGDQYRAALINGEERALTESVAFNDNQFTLSMPAFNSRIEAVLENGMLKGTLTLTKQKGKLQVMPLVATPGENFRFFEKNKPAQIDIGGKWEVLFKEADGTETPAIGEFHQEGNQAFGTFLTKTGDYRYLAGEVRDSSLFLSCFDGGHAFLFKANCQKDGTLDGDFWSGTAWHETWTAQRNEAVALPDAYELTFLKEGYDRFTFAFPNTDSVIVSLDDARYKDKVVLVTVVGSWCPNCHDEAKFLSKFYKENRERGLEIIALMYEHFPDFHQSAKQVNRFRKKFKIEYELLVAGYSDKKQAAATLPMLNHVLSYPTTIFIDKKGNVRKIHTGFTGPGTGLHYEKLIAEFRSFTDKLLAERF